MARAEEPEFPLVSKAAALIKAGKTDEAIKLAKQTVEQEELSAEAMVVLARCSIQKNKILEAIPYLEKAVQTSREEAFRAYAQLSLQGFPGPVFKKIDPKDPRREGILSYQEYVTEEYDKANRAIVADPQNVELLSWRADDMFDLYTNQEEENDPHYLLMDFAICDTTMAIWAADLKERTWCYRDRAQDWNLRAEDWDRDIYQKAADDLRRAVELQDDPRYKPYLDLAEALLKAGKYQESLDLTIKQLEQYEKTLMADPNALD